MSTRPLKPSGKLNDGKIPVRERLTLGEEWQSYQAAIFANLPDVSIVQRIETKRAFFAGARSLLKLQMGNLDAEHEPTELDLRYMDALDGELRAFVLQLETEAEVRAAHEDAVRAL